MNHTIGKLKSSSSFTDYEPHSCKLKSSSVFTYYEPHTGKLESSSLFTDYEPHTGKLKSSSLFSSANVLLNPIYHLAYNTVFISI